MTSDFRVCCETLAFCELPLARKGCGGHLLRKRERERERERDREKDRGGRIDGVGTRLSDYRSFTIYTLVKKWSRTIEEWAETWAWHLGRYLSTPRPAWPHPQASYWLETSKLAITPLCFYIGSVRKCSKRILSNNRRFKYRFFAGNLCTHLIDICADI